MGDNGVALLYQKERKRMLKLDGKKETSLGIYQFWPKKKRFTKVEGGEQRKYDGHKRDDRNLVFYCIKRTFGE